MLLIGLLLSLGIATPSAMASDVCEFETEYTLDKQCGGSGGVYVGPNRPEEHGGVCLYTNSECDIRTYYTLDKNCDQGWHYAGPNRADLHGGFCLMDANGHALRTHYTIEKDCGYFDEVYLGPNRPDLHGGVCLMAE